MSIDPADLLSSQIQQNFLLAEEVAKLKAENEQLKELVARFVAWQKEGEILLEKGNPGLFFDLGGWWADRPWRNI